MDDLNSKQRTFCENYVNNGMNITQAAMAAGYSEKTCHVHGSKLLKNAKVLKYIHFLQEKATSDAVMSRQEVLERLSLIASGNLKKLSSWGKFGVSLNDSESITDEEAYCLQEVSESTTDTSRNLKIKTCDKVKALELLAKHHGILENGKDRSDDDSEIKFSFAESIRSTIEKLQK